MEGIKGREPARGQMNSIHFIEMKPTVGFMLPWAGVTPAPSIKKEKMRDFVPVRTFFVSFRANSLDA
jgi:hypothetical protein